MQRFHFIVQNQRILSISPTIITTDQLTSNIIRFCLPFINSLPPRGCPSNCSCRQYHSTCPLCYRWFIPNRSAHTAPRLSSLSFSTTWSVKRDALWKRLMINQTSSKQANFRIPVFVLAAFLRVRLNVLASIAISRSFILRRESGRRVFAGTARCLGVQVPFKARLQDMGNFVLACVGGDLDVAHRDTG